MDNLPKVTAVPSVGYDFYDAKALREKGVKLCNSPRFTSHSVADNAHYLILQVYRFCNAFEASLRETKNTLLARQLATGLNKVTDIVEEENAQRVFCYGERAGGAIMQTPFVQTVGIAVFGAIGKDIG